MALNRYSNIYIQYLHCESMKQKGAFVDYLILFFFVVVLLLGIYFALVSFGVITVYVGQGTSTARISVLDSATGAVVTTATVTTSQDGTTYTGVFDGSQFYIFSNIPAGTYAFSASATGYSSGTSNNYMISDGQIINGALMITPSSPSQGCTDTDGGMAQGIKGTVTKGVE